MEDLNAASLDDVMSFFRTWYAPNNAVLSIVGDVDEEEAHSAAARYFGPIPANRDIRQPEPTPTKPVIGEEVRHRRARQRAADACAFRLPLPGVRNARVRCPGGRLRRSSPAAAARGCTGSLVREQRIAQDVTAFGLPLVNGASFFGGWVTVRPDSDAGSVSGAYLEELQRLVDEPVTDDELARARALIEASELGALGRVEEVADRLSMYAALFDRPEMVNEQLRATSR